MAGQRFRTRLTAFTLIVAGFLTSFVLTLALAPRAGAYVYWTTRPPPTPEPNPNPEGDPGTIGRANLDGTGVDEAFITARSNYPWAVAVDGAHVYWVEGPSRIGRANLDGTGVDHSFITLSIPAGGSLAVDRAHVYWDSGSDAIGRATVDGTEVDESFITGVNSPGGLAVDGSHLYWINQGRAPSDIHYPAADMIARANLDGTGVDEAFITHRPFIGGLAVDDTNLWWTYSDPVWEVDAIRRADLNGMGAESVVSGENFSAGSVAVDDTHVYWTTGGSYDAIGRAKLDGTRVDETFIIASTIIGIGNPLDLAVDQLGPRPLNQFRFGNVKKNKKRGTAKLTVKVPGSGDLQLAKTTKVKADVEAVEAAGQETLRVKPRRKARKRLASRGRAKVKAEVTYTPDGGEPNTQSKRVKLVKRP